MSFLVWKSEKLFCKLVWPKRTKKNISLLRIGPLFGVQPITQGCFVTSGIKRWKCGVITEGQTDRAVKQVIRKVNLRSRICSQTLDIRLWWMPTRSTSYLIDSVNRKDWRGLTKLWELVSNPFVFVYTIKYIQFNRKKIISGKQNSKCFLFGVLDPFWKPSLI